MIGVKLLRADRPDRQESMKRVVAPIDLEGIPSFPSTLCVVWYPVHEFTNGSQYLAGIYGQLYGLAWAEMRSPLSFVLKELRLEEEQARSRGL